MTEQLRHTYVRMSIPQQLVKDVAEFPAEHGVAGQRKSGDGRPEGVGAFLVVRAQDARWRRRRQGQCWTFLMLTSTFMQSHFFYLHNNSITEITVNVIHCKSLKESLLPIRFRLKHTHTHTEEITAETMWGYSWHASLWQRPPACWWPYWCWWPGGGGVEEWENW